MVIPFDTARRMSQLRSAPDRRHIRVHFASRAALLEGFALAQKESWIEDCHVDLARRELVIRMAGGFSIQPGRRPAARPHRPSPIRRTG